MKKYKTRIDVIINHIIDEYNGNNNIITKILNYEYYQGQLYMIYEDIKNRYGYEKLAEIYDYRREEKETYTEKFEKELIRPLYN